MKKNSAGVADKENMAQNEDAGFRQYCILILGMHRSGTSALTRVLNLLGAALPQKLMEPKGDNSLGFWESKDLMVLHDEILHSVGSHWHDWRRFNPIWMASPEADHFHRRLTEFIKSEFSNFPLYVVKDPRICRILPLWLSVLKNLNVTPLQVIPVRNPLEVADSLKVRNGFLTTKSCMIWLRHVLEAEKASRYLPRCVVTYDNLLKNWRSVTDVIAERLSIKWPRQSAIAMAEIDEFLNDRHRHHHKHTEDLDKYPEILKWLKNTYQTMLAMAYSGDSTASRKILDIIYTDFDRASTAFEAVCWAEQKATREEVLRRSRVKEDALRSKIQTYEESLHNMEIRLEATLSEVQRVEYELKTNREEKKRLQGDYEGSLEENECLKDELKVSLKEIKRLQSDYEESLEENECLKGELKASLEEIKRLQGDYEGNLKENECLKGELKASLEEIKRLQDDYEGSLKENECLKGELKASLKKIKHLQSDLTAISNSKLWRLTLPVRAVVSRFPRLAQAAMMMPKFLWWTITLLLLSRLRGVYRRNRDAKRARYNPLSHYLQTGVKEGRDPSPLFHRNEHVRQTPKLQIRSGSKSCRVTNLKEATIIQATPSKTQNRYYEMLPRELSKNGINIVFDPDINTIVERAENESIVAHFHQLEPFYHRSNEVDSKLAAEQLVNCFEKLQANDARIVHTWHNAFPHDRRFIAVDLWLYEQLNTFFDRVFVHARHGIPHIAEFIDRSKIRYLRHPSYRNEYGPIVPQVQARKSLGLPVDGHIIGSLGQIRPYKGLELIIEAWQAADKVDDMMLVIVGRAPDSDYLVKLSDHATKDIVFKGHYIDDGDINKWLASFNYMVIAHHDIWVSGVAVLASSYGVPVIAPYTPFISEYFRHEDHGLLYTPGNSASLANVFSESLNNDLIEHMHFFNADSGNIHDTQIVAKNYIEFLEELF